MDELDRFYRRLVQNIRGAAPEMLTRPFEVSQIYQELVPYRTNRRELGFDSNEDYELALMQLLAGLRGYLVVDSELQSAMRAELSSPNPDLATFRVYATSTVALAQERAVDHGLKLFLPPVRLCTDNAAMIAVAGYERYQRGARGDLSVIANPAWRL